MKDQVERNSRVTRRSSENRQSSRSSSGRAANKRSSSVSPYPDRTRNGRKRKCATDTSSAKKSNNIQNPPQKAQRRMFNNQPGDAFCWICHTLADEFFCPDCPRVYHNKCFKKIKFHLSEPVCECKWTSVDGPKSHPSVLSDLNDLLKLAIKSAADKNENKKNKETTSECYTYLKVWPEEDSNENNLCSTVDIIFLVDKIDNNFYKNTGQFFVDVKWMYHNAYITKGSDHILTTTAQKFEKAIKLQLSDMEACGECYMEKYTEYRSNDFFANLCSTPHSIVWAKLKGFPFWPAKCLRIMNGHADVRFFGTHDKSLIPLAQVYKISRRNPGGNPKKPKNSCRMTSYEESMAELSMYVSNYENRYGIGKFRYYNDKTPLQPVKLSGKKGRQRKNKSQLEDSVDTDADGCNDQSFPHLNVSLLHDDATETKASILHSAVRAAMDSSVVCHMTFDEEGPSEMNASEAVVEEPSYLHLAPQITELSGQVSIDSIESDQSGFSNNALSVQTNSDNFINTNDSSVVSSASTSSTTSSSPLVITSTLSLSDAVSNAANDSAAQYKKVLENILEQTAVPDLLPDGDDEIQVIAEGQRRSLVDNIFKNQQHLKTFCELILSNRPNVRNYVISFQNMALQFYLAMWLEANTGRFDANECKMFHSFCEKLCKTVESLKSQNRQLKSQVADLEQKLAAEKLATIGRASLRDQIIRAQARKNDEDAVRFKTELNRIFTELNDAKKNVKIFQDIATKYEIQLEQVQLDFEKQMQEVTTEKDKIIKDKEQMQETIEDKEKIINGLQKHIQYVTEENKRKTTELEEQKTHLQNVQTKHEKLVENKNDLEDSYNSLNLMFKEKCKELSEIKKQYVKEAMTNENSNADDKNTHSSEKSLCAVTDSSFVQHNQESTETIERRTEVTTTEEISYETLYPPGMLQYGMNMNVSPFMVPSGFLSHPVPINPQQVFSVENHEMRQSFESHKTVMHSSKQSASRDSSKSNVRVPNKRSVNEKKKCISKLSSKKR